MGWGLEGFSPSAVQWVEGVAQPIGDFVEKLGLRCFRIRPFVLSAQML